MTDKLENNNPKNQIEPTKKQIFEKKKEDSNPIHEKSLTEKITIDEAKSELKKIKEWIQGTKEKKDKKEIGKIFEELTKLKKSIDKTALKDEVNEIINSLKTLTKDDLAKLKQGIQPNKQRRNPERPIEVQKGIDLASNNLENLPNNDKNGIANRALEKIHEFLGG